MSTIGDFFSGVPVTQPGQGLNQYSGYSNAISQGTDAANSAISGQRGLATALQNQANGIGPSVAQQQFQENNQRIAAQAAGAIAGQKGISPGLGAALIARNQANVQGQGAGQAALARAQEQLGAQAQLGNVYGQEGQTGLGLGQLGTQGNLGQNNEIIQQQGIAAGQNAQNAQIGGQLAGSIAKGASSAFGVGAAHGGYASSPLDFRSGGVIPGQAKVAGDSEKNDIVPIMASPDEIMIPRSITQHEDAGELAKQFVEHVKAMKHGKKMSDGGTVTEGPSKITPIDYVEPQDGGLPAPPLVRAPVPLPFHGGSLDRYAPIPDQMKQMTGKPIPMPIKKAEDVEEETPAPKKTKFSLGGMIMKMNKKGR